jgi:chromosome partitioning protein
MNYKGGVGKTTLTANMAAEIANDGLRVLMIDLDPQANLTFSFFSIEEWTNDLRETRTIQLDLISSHLGLIDIDLQLAAQLGGTTLTESKRRFLQVHSCLAQALGAPAFRDYDVILIDCAPNFGLVTKTAIVASDYVLVPAKPDYLSTLGIGYLRGSVDKLVREYNAYVDHDPSAGGAVERIDPQFAGVAFTMTQIHAGQPILAQRTHIENLQEAAFMPVFNASVRNSPRYFSDAGADGVPAVLQAPLNDPVTVELRALTGEFVAAIANGRAHS